MSAPLTLADSLVANLYGLENMILAQGVDLDYRYNVLLNPALPALVLAIGAVIVAVRDRAPR